MAGSWVGRVLDHAPVTDKSELLMLVVLADSANKEGYCWPSRKTMAAQMRMDERSIPRIIRRLEKQGLVKAIRRQRTNGSDTSNGYQLMTWGDLPVTLSNKDGGDLSVTPGDGTRVTPPMTLQSPPEPLLEPLERRKEKESPAPIGDSLSGDDLIATAEAIVIDAFAGSGTTSVKAADSDSQPADSKTTEKLLPRPRETNAATPKPATPRKPLIEAVCYAFKEPYGSFPAKVGQWFLGKLKKKGDGWFEWQPAISPTPDLVPQQIIAFTLWYSNQDKYKESFVKQGHSMPQTPSLLRDHWDKYIARPQNVHDHWMAKAMPILERLLKGEKVEDAVVSSVPIESAQAYKPAQAKARNPYAVRTDPDEDVEPEAETPVGAFS